MARIDQLISVMLEHSASALMLVEGERPWLNIDGRKHALGKQVLAAEQATGLLTEIAPDESRSAIQSGHAPMEPKEFAWEVSRHRQYRVSAKSFCTSQ